MANKNKKKGTAAETRIVKYLQEHGIGAERKTLSGSQDKGDIKVTAIGWGRDLVFEVKSGKQTTNPNRKQLEDWMNQTIIEGVHANSDSLLVIARYGKNPADYDVWQCYENINSMRHWYLDEWCAEYMY